MVQCFGLPKQHEFLELSPECSAVVNVVINFGKHFGQGRQMSRRSSVLLCVASPGEILETELAQSFNSLGPFVLLLECGTLLHSFHEFVCSFWFGVLVLVAGA